MKLVEWILFLKSKDAETKLIFSIHFLGVGNGHLNFYTGFDVDGGNLLDVLGRSVQIDDTLVDAHLESIPGLGTLTARSLTGGDAQHLVGHANWSLDAKLLLLGARNQIGAYLLERTYVLRGKGDADSVHLSDISLWLLQVLGG